MILSADMIYVWRVAIFKKFLKAKLLLTKKIVTRFTAIDFLYNLDNLQNHGLVGVPTKNFY